MLNQINSIINKAKIMGLQIDTIPTYCGHECYVVFIDSDTQYLCIPENVRVLNSLAYSEQDDPCDILTDASGIGPFATNFSKKNYQNLKVIGGEGLINTDYMFQNSWVRSIDLSKFRTDNCVSMEGMFESCLCDTDKLDLSVLNTHKVKNMSRMFANIDINKLHFEHFNTSSAVDMTGMFPCVNTDKLDLSNFNTSKVERMAEMFKGSIIGEIQLEKFDTNNVTSMFGMFASASIVNLDLSSFSLKRLEYANSMFVNCNAKQIRLSSISINKIKKASMYNVFTGCNAKIIVDQDIK